MTADRTHRGQFLGKGNPEHGLASMEASNDETQENLCVPFREGNRSANITFVMSPEILPAIKEFKKELGARLSLKYGISFSKIPVRKVDWEKAETPFLQNVREEAIAA